MTNQVLSAALKKSNFSVLCLCLSMAPLDKRLQRENVKQKPLRQI